MITPGAASLGDLAFGALELCLGAYPVDFSAAWSTPDYWDADDIALEMPDHPNIWTEGSREDFSSIGGFEVAGAGTYLPASEIAFDSSIWGTAEENGDARLERCRAFLPVPGVMQTVQRAEFWGAILALQANWPCHLGIDNLNVAWSIGRLLDHDSLVEPLPLVKDGDLIALAWYMIRTPGLRDCSGSLRLKGMLKMLMFSKVGLGCWINRGMLRLMLLLIWVVVISLRFLLMLGVGCLRLGSHWYPIMLDLHRFMIAVARVSVNHDGRGGTALIPGLGSGEQA